MRLNEIVTRYLEANGISKKYFSECIGCDLAVTYKWLNGEIKTLPADKLKKIHSFLNGELYKALGCKSETWLSMVEPKKNQKENK